MCCPRRGLSQLCLKGGRCRLLFSMQACARAAGHHVRCCAVRWVAVCNPCLAMPCGRWRAGHRYAQFTGSAWRRVALRKPAGADARAMLGGLEMSTLTIRLPDDTAQRLKSLGAKPGPLYEQIGGAAQCARAGGVGYREPFPRHGRHGGCAESTWCAGSAGCGRCRFG